MQRIQANITDQHHDKLQALQAIWRFRTTRSVEECIDRAYAQEMARLELEKKQQAGNR